MFTYDYEQCTKNLLKIYNNLHISQNFFLITTTNFPFGEVKRNYNMSSGEPEIRSCKKYILSIYYK